MVYQEDKWSGCLFLGPRDGNAEQNQTGYELAHLHVFSSY